MNAVATRNKWTALHAAARDGHDDVVKVLLQNGADVNAVNWWKKTALHESQQIHAYFTCLFGAQIDEKAIKDDNTELLEPIENRLKLLRDGKRIGTSLMSKEERLFMWNLACVLAIKHLHCSWNIPKDSCVRHISRHFHGALI